MSVASVHRLTAAQPNLSHDPHRHPPSAWRTEWDFRQTHDRASALHKTQAAADNPIREDFLEDLKRWNHSFELLLQRLVILHILSALFRQMDKGVAEV